ncbi:MAG: protelomerase family protein, partial [Thermosynechococcaceae cyanobacterium]
MTLFGRAEIINRFRDRIRNSDHVRLSSDDLDGLIAGFVEELTRTNTEQEIRALCEAEIKLLEEGYPQPSVAKYLSRYRKAIGGAIADGVIVMDEKNSHRFIHQQRVTGIQEERFEHWALTFLKYSLEVYESFDTRSQSVNGEKGLEQPLVPVDRYLALLREFLETRGRFESRWLAAAIAGVTGRRFAEVIAKGKFSLASHPYLLRFEGRGGTGYDFVTLLPADVVLRAIRRLRRVPEVRAIALLKGTERSRAINAFIQKINAVCGKRLMQVVPLLEGKKAVSVHDLRGLYGAIALHFFCPNLEDEVAFVQRYLGHGVVSAGEGHDFGFGLGDDQGKPIRDMGVLVDQVGPLPLVEKVEGVGMVAEGAIAPVPTDWIAELDRQVERLRAEFVEQIEQVRRESDAGWFVRRVEGLERENLTLRLERDRAIASGQDGASAEVQRLRAVNGAIAAELKQVQDKLDAFRRLLDGVDAGAGLLE